MKRNRLILAGILLLLVATYIILRINRPEEKLRPVYDLKTKEISKIEVYDQADTLKLELQKGIWKLVSPVSWEADTLRIQELYSKVLVAKYPTTPMGEGKEAIKRYKLGDDQALHIVVDDGSKRVHAMFSNLGNPYDYFRFAGSEKVYQIKAQVGNIFTTQLYTWRSPHVVNYEEAELERISVKHLRNKYLLTRKQYDWYFKDDVNDFKIPQTNLAIMKVVNILSKLDTYLFVDGGEKEHLNKFDKPDCEVTLFLTDKSQRELSFVEYDDQQYLMMVDNDPSVLFVVSFDTVFRFMRHAEVFRSRAY